MKVCLRMMVIGPPITRDLCLEVTLLELGAWVTWLVHGALDINSSLLAMPKPIGHQSIAHDAMMQGLQAWLMVIMFSWRIWGGLVDLSHLPSTLLWL